jgi:signal peptidase I
MTDPTRLAVDAAKAPRRKHKKPSMGPIRANLEAFGVAILAAVLLKWFCIEAFQIPTSSMQPTLMGDTAAGVYDRILVDKLLPTIREPKRWDITVFKYPLQKNQNYVKRIGGMPRDRLYIGGGNLYQVTDEGGKRTYAIVRRPRDLQQEMWKNVFPARAETRGETKWLGDVIGASPSRAFTEDASGLEWTLDSSRSYLFFRDEADGGMIDRVWDGYPAAVSRAIREHNTFDQPQEIVPDARIAATLTAEQAVDELSFEVVVARPGFDTLVFELVLAKGVGRLIVAKQSDGKALVGSPEFDCALAPGTATEIAFAHIDDELVAWRDGRELARVECGEYTCREGCVLPFTLGGPGQPSKLGKPDNQRVTPQIAAKGKGKLRIENLRIDRDQHYVRGTGPEIIEVPEGHYYMLGDNTLQSIDSRGWTAITVGVDADGYIVPPTTPGARVVRGNKRAMELDRPPDRDETPIPIPSRHEIVMIDEFGEILRLKGDVGPDWGKRVSFLGLQAQDGRGDWVAPETTNTVGISFVPRTDIQGRAVLVFYPSRPFSWLTGNAWPGRFGFVR